MKKVAVILAGCGVKDGSEIYETVSTYLALEKANLEYISLAPDMDFVVTNHLTQEATDENRNILVESARLARMNIKDITTVSASDFDAVILPGGFGAAMNISNFGEKQADAQVNPSVEKFVAEMLKLNKPVAAMCIAPGALAIIARNAGKNLKLTFGKASQFNELVEALKKLGHTHVDCEVSDCVIDEENKVVSTPAFMLGKNIKEIYQGIDKLVQAIAHMIS